MAGKTFDDVYKMTSNPLGFCVIINMIHFDNNKYEERSASIPSMLLVKNTFQKLKFEVIIYEDLTYQNFMRSLKEILKKEECNSHDCLVLYIHSHGQQNGFVTADNKVIQIHKTIELFSHSNCSKFINKPKLIFFDFCRGGQFSTQ